MSLGHGALSPGSLFLVRESQRNPQGFVLSLCHVQKVKHYLILPVSSPGFLQWRHRTASTLSSSQALSRGIPSLPPPPPPTPGSGISCSLLSPAKALGDFSPGPGGSSRNLAPLPDLPPLWPLTPERGGGSPLLQHGRRPDSLHRPAAARRVPPAEPRHPALLAAPLLHPCSPLSTRQAGPRLSHSRPPTATPPHIGWTRSMKKAGTGSP